MVTCRGKLKGLRALKIFRKLLKRSERNKSSYKFIVQCMADHSAKFISQMRLNPSIPKGEVL
jgi:hypothetical protein